RDVDLALVDLDFHGARPLVREQRHTLDRVRQAIALELDVFVVALRNHALVGGELPVDHPRDQQAIVEFEEQMVLAALVIYVVVPDSGSVGKSSRGRVCMRESNRSAATFTPPLSSAIRMSVSGSDLTISKNFFAGSVSDPPFEIVALHLLRRPTSRSVARKLTESPFASI